MFALFCRKIEEIGKFDDIRPLHLKLTCKIVGIMQKLGVIVATKKKIGIKSSTSLVDPIGRKLRPISRL